MASQFQQAAGTLGLHLGVLRASNADGASATVRTRRSKGSLLDADTGSRSNAD